MTSAVRPVRLCEIPGCTRKHRGKGMCELHLKRWRTGSPLAPAELPPDNKGKMTRAQIQLVSDMADAACPRVIFILHPNFRLPTQ